MYKTRLTLIGLAFLLLTGCQRFPTRDSRTASTFSSEQITLSEARQISNLLSYYRDLNGLGEGILKARLIQLGSGLEKDGCSTARLKSAMILSQLPSQSATSGANAVLKPCLDEAFAGDSTQSKLALLLRDLIETRGAARGALAQAEDYQHKLKVLEDENQKLHKQLEGLKAIEKSIQQRNRH